MYATDNDTVPSPVEASGWTYRFVSILGEGRRGVVYRAVRQRDGRDEVVAVKVFTGLSSEDAARFHDDLGRLLHPADERLVHAYDVLTVEECPALAMELVDGWSLAHFEGRSLEPRVVAEIGTHVAEALVAAWECRPTEDRPALNLVHGDLGPGDLMVTRSGDLRVLGAGTLPATTGRAAQASRADDVYGLGAALLAMRTGASPDPRADHAPALASITREPLAKLLGEMLAPDPRARPSPAQVQARLAELARTTPGGDLAAWVSGGRTTGEPTVGNDLARFTPSLDTSPHDAKRAASRRGGGGGGLGAGLAAGLVTAVALGIGTWWWSVAREDAERAKPLAPAPAATTPGGPPASVHSDTPPGGAGRTTGTATSGGAGATAAAGEPSPWAAPAATARITAQVSEGCVVTADGTTVDGAAAIVPGPITVGCAWMVTSTGGTERTVRRSVTGTAVDGGTLRVVCAPSANRCAVEP